MINSEKLHCFKVNYDGYLFQDYFKIHLLHAGAATLSDNWYFGFYKWQMGLQLHNSEYNNTKNACSSAQYVYSFSNVSSDENGFTIKPPKEKCFAVKPPHVIPSLLYGCLMMLLLQVGIFVWFLCCFLPVPNINADNTSFSISMLYIITCVTFFMFSLMFTFFSLLSTCTTRLPN